METVRSQNKGNTDKATNASRQLSQNISTIIPARISDLAIMGRTAVTTTSCNSPTSLITRTTRTPVRARVWKESERY